MPHYPARRFHGSGFKPLGQAKCVRGVHDYLTRRFHGSGNKPLGQAKCVRGVHRVEAIGVQGGFTAAGPGHWDRQNA